MRKDRASGTALLGARVFGCQLGLDIWNGNPCCTFLGMQKLPFKSITVQNGETGHYRNITSVKEANEFLLHNWPKGAGIAQLAARAACLDALMGALPAEAARTAFIKATQEAGIYVAEGEWR
jgi:hypothetical protein